MTDISQVNIRQRAREIRYDDKLLLKVFLQSSQARIEVVDKIENTDRVALYDFENDVLQIARCEDRTKLFNELTQELAKQEIGENCDYADFKVNAVSYMICKKYNLNFLNYNITDIPYGLTTILLTCGASFALTIISTIPSIFLLLLVTNAQYKIPYPLASL